MSETMIRYDYKDHEIWPGVSQNGSESFVHIWRPDDDRVVPAPQLTWPWPLTEEEIRAKAEALIDFDISQRRLGKPSIL